MRHSVQSGEVVRTLLAHIKSIYEGTKTQGGKTKPPTLKFHEDERIVQFGDHVTKLSPQAWKLFYLLSTAPGGVLSFLDSCEVDDALCPWRNKQDSAPETKRSAASRLSIRLWEKGIPYKIIYRQATNEFELVFLDQDEQANRVVCVTSHTFLTIETAGQLKKVVQALIFLLPVLQEMRTDVADDPEL